MRFAGHVARMEHEKCVQNCSLKPEGKRPFGRPKRR